MAKATSPSTPAEPTRSSFALTGPSVPLDPRTNAVRRDLADIRLAGQVFAPHFAAPLTCRLVQSATLRADPDGEVLIELAASEPFEVLELSGKCAWGRAPGPGIVGYLDRSALDAA